MLLMPTPKGLVFTVDLSKLADLELPEGSEMTVEEYRRTIEAPISKSTSYAIPVTIDWGDGTSETYSIGAYIEHTYPVGTGDKFTVVIRSANGQLPNCRLKATANDILEHQVELACVSIDHFAGWMGGYNESLNLYASNRVCSNLEYCDPRYIVPNASSLGYFFRNANLKQNVESFCFDFVTQNGSLTQLFGNNKNLKGSIPEHFFDNVTRTTTFTGTFQNCSTLTGDGYVFWKEDGSLDTDKFPLLDSAASCYSGCTGIDRSKIPTAYGGTMTVS